jgi:hypothetical protein
MKGQKKCSPGVFETRKVAANTRLARLDVQRDVMKSFDCDSDREIFFIVTAKRHGAKNLTT